MHSYFICIILISVPLYSTSKRSSTSSSEEHSTDFASFAYTQLVDEQHTIDKVLFAPTEATTIESVLIGLIRSTQTSIVGALFRLSNKKIIEELIAAHQRGVIIDIILDPEAMSTSKEISKLSHAGIPLSLYNQKKYGTYMHHKFLIFHNALACAENNYIPIPAVLAYGSLNLTQQGFNGNRENINFRDKSSIVNAFMNEITQLKEGTDRYILARSEPSTSQNSEPAKTKSKLKLSRIRKISTHLACIKRFLK